MKRVSLVTLLLICVAAIISPAQTNNSRTPGRVGGSPNRPTVLVPRPTTPIHANLIAVNVLSPDEQKQYALAQQSVPGLTVYDFFQLQYLSEELRKKQPDVDVVKLAQEVGSANNHVTTALRHLGMSKKEANDAYSAAQKAADAKAEQLSQ